VKKGPCKCSENVTQGANQKPPMGLSAKMVSSLPSIFAMLAKKVSNAKRTMATCVPPQYFSAQDQVPVNSRIFMRHLIMAKAKPIPKAPHTTLAIIFQKNNFETDFFDMMLSITLETKGAMEICSIGKSFVQSCGRGMELVTKIFAKFAALSLSMACPEKMG